MICDKHAPKVRAAQLLEQKNATDAIALLKHQVRIAFFFFFFKLLSCVKLFQSVKCILQTDCDSGCGSEAD
jgi:hypothetical protein